MPEREGCLILKTDRDLCEADYLRIKEMAEPLARSMGLQAIVLSSGLDATVIPAGIGELIQEIRAQTAAISQLAQSNEMLAQVFVQAMAEEQGMDDAPVSTYLNGKPRT